MSFQWKSKFRDFSAERIHVPFIGIQNTGGGGGGALTNSSASLSPRYTPRHTCGRAPFACIKSGGGAQAERFPKPPSAELSQVSAAPRMHTYIRTWIEFETQPSNAIYAWFRLRIPVTTRRGDALPSRARMFTSLFFSFSHIPRRPGRRIVLRQRKSEYKERQKSKRKSGKGFRASWPHR